MEQIVKENGQILYGKQRCTGADDAYCRFRDDYHDALGKRAYERLNRLGQREERIHGYGFVFAHPVYFGGDDGGACKPVDSRLFGLVEGSYCRGVGAWDIPDYSEDEFERWFDWAFSRGSGALRLVGRKDKSGRTNKRLNARYR
jgi:hypothetical protein